MGSEGPDRATSFEGIPVPTAALEGASLLAGLDRDDLAVVASRMRLRAFDAGAVICREGEHGESMFVIVDGLVHLLVSLPSEPAVRTRSIFDEGRLVGKLRRGDVIATGPLVTGEPHPATARAAVATDALELGRDDFRELIGRFPRMLENLTAILTRRLAEATTGRARSGGRGEAVALLTGRTLAPAVPGVLEATSAASPQPVAAVGVRGRAADALDELDALLGEHRTVVLDADLEGGDLAVLLQHVDRAVAVVGTDSEAERLAGAAIEHGVKGQPVEAVALAGVELPARAGDALDLVRVARGSRGSLDPGELAWVGRHLTRTKLGVALGAGGAKGYALIGALQVLESEGYAIDYVSGSSIGAIVGAWLALGLDAAEIEAAMRATFTPEVAAEALKVSLSGQASGHETMVGLLRELAGERTFADCRIPLTVMTADLAARGPAPIRDGSLADALIAATALAGVFPPHETGDRRLVDGLAIDPVPTAAVIEDGADVTVSVNLIPRETLPAWPGRDAPPTGEPRRRGSRMLDTLLEVMDLAQLDTSERGAALADVAVTPRFGPGSWRDFELGDLFLAAGREAMQEHLPALRELASPRPAGSTG